MLAAADFDLYGPNDCFGSTLTYDNDKDSRQNEPNAALPGDGIDALKLAHDSGIRTWALFEPVLDPQQTLFLIELTHEFVDYFRIGKLNHYSTRIDWSKFRNDVELLMQRLGRRPGTYSLKRQLIEAGCLIRGLLGEEIKMIKLFSAYIILDEHRGFHQVKVHLFNYERKKPLAAPYEELITDYVPGGMAESAINEYFTEEEIVES
jgi:hypothetical protein